jgi:hypothetical protein
MDNARQQAARAGGLDHYRSLRPLGNLVGVIGCGFLRIAIDWALDFAF